jgi:hypothetical protein
MHHVSPTRFQCSRSVAARMRSFTLDVFHSDSIPLPGPRLPTISVCMRHEIINSTDQFRCITYQTAAPSAIPLSFPIQWLCATWNILRLRIITTQAIEQAVHAARRLRHDNSYNWTSLSARRPNSTPQDQHRRPMPVTAVVGHSALLGKTREAADGRGKKSC